MRGLFPSCGERGLLSSGGVKASLVAEPGLWETDSIVVVHGLTCALARGIFPNQEANSSPALAGGFFTTEPSAKPYF